MRDRFPGCDVEDCLEDAEYWFDVAWSESDFGQWYACVEHLAVLHQWLRQRRVDGGLAYMIGVHALEDVV